MEFNLKVGMSYKAELQVELKDTAVSLGSGSVKVLATPRMIALMENAALNAVDADLPEGYSTVGTHLDAKHMAATPIGMKVYAEAELVKIEGKKLTFNVVAYDEKDKIGEGTHTRYVIAVDSFIEKTNQKLNG
ncbi:thioesterase family protein [Clostridium formicaceticum]|jgi:predicted thioesterase|uniref:Thioesterase n=1 Tax=Clostridium formicaceticum TaxID=1497 RepID=A0AAC9RFY1_9CLOT|nr:thioesterase family protein [Clostridium formicaceticum]AOY75752.1 thioesterase [Clostridium formicaceticum]ARE86076.1 Fluoroacetyl-CoA thioesterase [Clostridium formicaceticum]